MNMGILKGSEVYQKINIERKVFTEFASLYGSPPLKTWKTNVFAATIKCLIEYLVYSVCMYVCRSG